MKNLVKIFTVFLAILLYSCIVQRPVSAQQGDVSFQLFYDQLSPYGQWVDYPNWGVVWIPEVGPDFSPYASNGYWVMTEYGWTWVSGYRWGWAPFHYGRWDWDNVYGWFWVPGNEWGPSWVTWRRANGYYGWTPMRPGISVTVSFGGEYRDPDHWYFVKDRDFGRQDIGHYYVNRGDNVVIIKNSTVINNTYIDNSRNTTYITGPHGTEVQQVTGRRISSVPIRDYDRPGEKINNSQLEIYRPHVERFNNASQKPTPSRITNLKDIKPVNERATTNRRDIITPVQNNRRVDQKTQYQRQTEKTDQVQQNQQTQQQQRIERVNQVQQNQQVQQQQKIDKDNKVQQNQQIQQQQNTEVSNQGRRSQQGQIVKQNVQKKKVAPGVTDNRRKTKQKTKTTPDEKKNDDKK